MVLRPPVAKRAVAIHCYQLNARAVQYLEVGVVLCPVSLRVAVHLEDVPVIVEEFERVNVKIGGGSYGARYYRPHSIRVGLGEGIVRLYLRNGSS
jgi:cytosine/adenosine deaminase-related metal-dependent hydrolase